MMVKFQLMERPFQMIFQRVQAFEEAVVEGFLPQVIPKMLDRIEFGRVRRQFEQAHIGCQRKGVAPMPTGAIKHHDDPLARMAGGDLVEEELHALAIDAGQNQGIQLDRRPPRPPHRRMCILARPWPGTGAERAWGTNSAGYPRCARSVPRPETSAGWVLH